MHDTIDAKKSIEFTLYSIDADDKICAVGGLWEAFAAENDAVAMEEHNVVGKSIWQFFSGAATRKLYEELFDKLRSTKVEVTIPFRCDSPWVIRQMELRLKSGPMRSIHAEGLLCAKIEREEVRVLARDAKRTTRRVAVCSVCRLFFVGGHWVEARAALARHLLCAPEVPELDEVVCPTCLRTIEAL